MFRRVLTIAIGGTLGVTMLALVSLRVAAVFGAGAQLDAYIVAVAGPALLLSLSGTVTSSYMTPRLAALDDAGAARRAGEWALLVFLVSAVLALLVILGRHAIVRVLAPGLAPASAALAAHVLLFYVLSVPATLASTVYGALGIAHRRVWVSGASTSVYAALWLVLLLTPTFSASVSRVALAGVLASQLQLLAAFAFVAIGRHVPWPRWRAPAHPGLAIAAIAGVALNVTLSKANVVIDPIFGSVVGRGDVSLLAYATRLMVLVAALCGQGPALAVLGARRSTEDGRNPLAASGFGVTVLLTAGIATAVAITFVPVAKLVLGHGQFTAAAAAHVGRLVEAYAPSIVLITIAWYLESVLYSLRVAWRLVAMNVPALAINVGLSFALLPALGVDARPIAVAVALTVYVLMLAGYLRTLPHGLNVWQAVPVRAVIRVVALVAVLSEGAVVIGNAVAPSPGLWAVVALSAAVVTVALAIRSWLSREGDQAGPLAVTPTSA